MVYTLMYAGVVYPFAYEGVNCGVGFCVLSDAGVHCGIHKGVCSRLQFMITLKVYNLFHGGSVIKIIFVLVSLTFYQLQKKVLTIDSVHIPISFSIILVISLSIFRVKNFVCSCLLLEFL